MRRKNKRTFAQPGVDQHISPRCGEPTGAFLQPRGATGIAQVGGAGNGLSIACVTGPALQRVPYLARSRGSTDVRVRQWSVGYIGLHPTIILRARAKNTGAQPSDPPAKQFL